MISVEGFRATITILMPRGELREKDLLSKQCSLPTGISLSEWDAGRQFYFLTVDQGEVARRTRMQ